MARPIRRFSGWSTLSRRENNRGSTPRSKPDQSRSNYLDEIVTRKKAVIWHILVRIRIDFKMSSRGSFMEEGETKDQRILGDADS
jgi:hypothetical protein